jgi:ATPase subunit of ABC transporter with duplicated ATPase domains
MASKLEKQVLVDTIRGDLREVSFTKMITEQQLLLRKLKSMSGGKPNKVEQAYFDQQQSRLDDLEKIVKSWIWEAFEDDDNVVHNTMYWGELSKHYSVKVYVEKKKTE